MDDAPLLSIRFLEREDIPNLNGLKLNFKGVLHNSNWNTLIGQVTHWDVPHKEADYFLRKERFGFIEITIK